MLDLADKKLLIQPKEVTANSRAAHTWYVNSKWGLSMALGGGAGAGSSFWGPAVDNVLGLDVVSTWKRDTADWNIVRINATCHPDLFWGMLVQPFHVLNTTR